MSAWPYLTQFTKVIDASTELSDVSKKTYKDRLRRLTTMTGHDVDWIIMHCKGVYEAIKKYETQTQKGYINTVLMLFKYTDGLKKKKKKVYDCWYKLFMKVAAQAEEKYNNMEASDRQKKVYVPWAKILETRDGLAKDSQEYLLLSLYTMIPPSRADMNAVKILGSDDEVDVKKYPNYMVLYDDKIKLVYNEFKSKSRRLQKYEKILPANLEGVVRRSLMARPRDYLVVSPRTGQPYATGEAFAKYFDRVLERVFGKKVTINTLRHSFINSLDLNKLTPLEKEIIARDMMHSKDMMDKYRLLVPGSESANGRDQVCEVVCRDQHKS